jgi:hypothetical protein
MMHRIRLSTAAVTIGALVALVASPAGGQQVPDVPPLGFTISPTEGAVGSTVSGTVDTTDVEANCITDASEFVAQFVDLEDPIGVVTPQYLEPLAAFVDGLPGEPFEDASTNPTSFAALVAAFFPIGLALDLPPNGTGELAEGALAQTFVMAFADAATATPVDPLGSFDPTTGEGSVTVPDVAAGPQPVIATCVALREGLTADAFATALEPAAAFVEANLEAPFPTNPLAEEFRAAATQVAPVILRELVDPQALGIQFFCVHDSSGACPGGEPTPTPPTAPPAPPATPVPGRPSFTG